MRSDAGDDDDLQNLNEKVDEIAASHGLSILREHRESLEALMMEIWKIHNEFAFSRELRVSRGQTVMHVKVDAQWHENSSSITLPDNQPKVWTTFRIDRRGPDEYVVRIDAVEIRCGRAADGSLAAAIQRAAAEQFLSAYGREP